MKISTETVGKWLAEGRNYGSIAVGFIGGIGIVSVPQQKGLSEAISQMYDGAMLIVTGASSFSQIVMVAFPIIGVALAKWAKNSAKVDNQAAAVQAAAKDPNTDISMNAKASMLDAVAEAVPLAKPIEVKDKALANTVPSDLVIAK